MFSLLSDLFRSPKPATYEPRPRPPRFRAKRDAAKSSALLNVLGWQPPVLVQRESLVGRAPRIS